MFNAIPGGPKFHIQIICLSVDSTDPSIIRSVSLESHLYRWVFDAFNAVMTFKNKIFIKY
jgi:hypothetical protein